MYVGVTLGLWRAQIQMQICKGLGHIGCSPGPASQGGWNLSGVSRPWQPLTVLGGRANVGSKFLHDRVGLAGFGVRFLQNLRLKLPAWLAIRRLS